MHYSAYAKLRSAIGCRKPVVTYPKDCIQLIISLPQLCDATKTRSAIKGLNFPGVWIIASGGKLCVMKVTYECHQAPQM